MVKHKARVTNRVADGLSRQNNLLTAMQLEFDSFHDLLDTHPYFSPILAAVRMGERSNFLLHDGFLFKGNQFCVLDCSLQLCII